MSARNLGFLVVCALLLGVLLGLQVLTRPDPTQRNHEIFTEMAYGQGYDAWEPNAHFADGRTVQPLVAGVVPRGRLPFPYGDGPEEATRAGAELVNPVPADDPLIEELGSELFRINCVICHDARGTGQGKAVLRGMLPPPNLHAARATGIADGELFHIITRGQGNMDSYAVALSEHERWLVIGWVRQLQQEGP
ncbi:MAG: c-type cytochrome [Planctomycetota bacterium]